MGGTSIQAQWQAWQHNGEWRDHDTQIVELLAQVPWATTGQLAWVLYPAAQTDSALVMTRAMMRRLRGMQVIEHRRLHIGGRGRPEDCYRLVPGWATMWEYAMVPLQEDWRRDWLVTERTFQAIQDRTELVRQPEGASQAEWVSVQQASGRHWHRYEYVIDGVEDGDRLAAALQVFVGRFGVHFLDSSSTHLQGKPCGRSLGRCDGVEFMGWDLIATFGNPADREDAALWTAYLKGVPGLDNAALYRGVWVSAWSRNLTF